jgi:4-hydroxy-2-oxoheptanedioate aldolase
MVRINGAKAKMLAGQPAFGYALALGSPLVAEAIASTGIDFILVDGQHGSYGPDSTIAAFMAMSSFPVAPMARVSSNDFTKIGRLLDEGALGIVVPMVNTAADAKAAADACRFPPIGTRSWGYGRAARYGDDYTDWIDDQVFVAVQIETAEAVENAEAIMATPGVDGCWLGPSDLALSLGIHPRDRGQSEEHHQAVENVLAACRNTGKVAGYAGGSPEEALALAARGFQFLTSGSDIGFMLEGALRGVKQMGLTDATR